VTVVMPYWRAAGTYRRAVDSIVAQTFKDWRLLVVVDGDRQMPPPVDDHRVSMLVLSENGGFSNAHHVALDHVDTEWWTAHDADDWSDPVRFAHLFNQVDGDVDAVLAPVVEHRRDGTRRVRPVLTHAADQESLVHVGWPQAGLFRTGVAQQVGWLPDVRYGWDSVFVGLVTRHYRVKVTGVAHYHLVRRAGSLTTHRGTAAYARDRNRCQAEWAARR